MNKLLIHNALVYREGRFTPGDVLVMDGKIAEIGETLNNNISDDMINAQGNYVVPGLIDVHTHGSGGIDVNSATAEDLGKISEFFASKGCTGWLASVLSDSEEKTIYCMHQIKEAMNNDIKGARLLGVHLEGPFLNSEYKGAMPEHLLQKGNITLFSRYQKESDSNIRYMTVAPEVDGVMELIDYAVAQGVVVAMGHSAAGYDLAMEAVSRGVSACTHTFNGMKLFHQHEPSLMGAVLESEDVYCEFICDYLHLHPGSVRFLIKTKGTYRAIAVTDSISAAGLTDGEYMLGVNEVVVLNGDARLKFGDSRAGSTLTINKALKNVIDITRLPLEIVIRMFSENQAAMLGISDRYGTIDVGKCADMVIMSNDYDVLHTIINGKVVFSRTTDL